MLGGNGPQGDRAIAGRYDLARSSLQRHKKNHMARAVAAVVRATGALTVARGFSTLDRVEGLFDRVEGFVDALDVRKPDGSIDLAKLDSRGLAGFVRELTKLLDLRARLLGEITPATTTVNVLLDARGKERPEWARARKVIFDALRPWPDAAEAVAEALAADAATVVSQEGIAA
jgi:hypothetical protein